VNLASHQRAMLQLFREPIPVTRWQDSYMQKIAASRDLKEAKHTVFLWRSYVLARTAPLTFNLLKQRRQLRSEVDLFIASHNISPFRETHAPAFLRQVSRHADPLVARVARFEMLLQNARNGDSTRRRLRWQGDPRSLLSKLASGVEALADDVDDSVYEIVFGADIPGYFEIFDLSMEFSARGAALDVASIISSDHQ